MESIEDTTSELEFDPTNQTTWLSGVEAAELIGRSPATITKAIKNGDIVPIRRGRMLFIKKEDILKYKEKMDLLGNSKHDPRRHGNWPPVKTVG